MPYTYTRSFNRGRALGQRFGPNRRLPTRKYATCTQFLHQAFVSGTPVAGFIDNNIRGDFFDTLTETYYITWMRWYSSMFNTTVVANYAPSSAVARVFVADQSSAALDLDPITTVGRNRFPSAEQCWVFGHEVTPPAGPQTSGVVRSRYFSFHKRPLRLAPHMRLWLSANSATSAGNQNYDGIHQFTFGIALP